MVNDSIPAKISPVYTSLKSWGSNFDIHPYDNTICTTATFGDDCDLVYFSHIDGRIKDSFTISRSFDNFLGSQSIIISRNGRFLVTGWDGNSVQKRTVLKCLI